MRYLLVFLVLPCLSGPGDLLAQGKRYYVNVASTGANNGLSWTNAFKNLQTALGLAQAGDAVWVAQGTYKPTGAIDRGISFELKSGVQLYGGFAGTESDPAQRDWVLYQTVLDGDIGVPGDSTDNSYNVLYLFEPDSNTLADGLVLRHGSATDPQVAFGIYDRAICGGGLYVMAQDAEGYPTIRNCRFEHNTANNYGGGAMVNGSADGSVAPRFVNCTFESNRSGRNGGGLARLGGSWVGRGIFIDSCTFSANTALQRGGGLFFSGSTGIDSLMFQGSIFEKNYSGLAGGGAFFLLGRPGKSYFSMQGLRFTENTSGDGAALDLFTNGNYFDGYIEIKDCIINNNFSNPNAMTSQNSILYLSLLGTLESRFTLKNSIFEQNNSSHVQMILLEFSDAEAFIVSENFSKNLNSGRLCSSNSFSRVNLINSHIQKNTSIFLFDFSSTYNIKLFNCLFDLNDLRLTNASGSSIFAFNTIPFADFSLIHIQGCTFNQNSATTLFFKDSPNEIPGNNPVIIADNIFHDSTGINYFQNKNTYITHCAFDAFNCAALPLNVTCGPDILTGIDPLFINPDSGDFRLQPCSPLINAGSNAFLSADDTTDLAGLPRVRGGTVDIGAYEAQGPSLAATPQASPSCPGGASGALELAVQDACPPLGFAWQSGTASGASLSGLPAGDYQLTLTDAKGQQLVFSATVPQGPGPALTGHSTPAVCGDTLGGSASAGLDAGTLPFSYQWAGSGSTDSLRSGLAAGAYPLTVTDARGCTAAGTVEVGKTGNLGVNIEVMDISCSGAADGGLTVLPANGKAPFTWHWSGGANTPSLSPLGPGTYLGTLTDALDCTIGWVLPLGEPGVLRANPIVGNASDSMAMNGRIELQPTGGTAPYSVLWSTGATGLSIDSLAAGWYTLTLTDAHDCTWVETVAVGVTSGIQGTDPGLSGLRLLPNPAAESVWLELAQPAAADWPVGVYNSAGQLVRETWLPAGMERVRLHTAELPRGVYFVRVAGRMEKLVLE